LGTNISKAFVHEITENNYFAWLYDYKNKNPGCTLQTEYDLAKQENEDLNDNNEKEVTWTKLKLLCPRRMVVTMSWCYRKVPP
jgi:hypothetical protein